MAVDAVGRFEETLATLDAALTELLQIPTVELSQQDVEGVLEVFYRLTHRGEGVKLHLLRAGLTTTSRHVLKSFLTTAPRNIAPGLAERDLDLARCTDPDVCWDGVVGGLNGDRGTLALTGAKVVAGDASRAHLDQARTALKSMPTSVRRGSLTTVEVDADGVVAEVSRPKARVLDGFLASTATEVAPGAAKQITDDMLMLLDPDRSDRGREPDSESMRGVRWSRVCGMDRLTIDVTHYDAPFLRQVLQAAAAPDPTDPVTGEGDERCTQQRVYDGLLDLLHVAESVTAAQAAVGDEGAAAVVAGLQQRATVLVHASVDQVARHTSGERVSGRAGSPVVDGQGPVRREVFEHLSCDAQVRRVLFTPEHQPLNLRSVARAATENQRQVLAARDRGCVAPGCGKPSWLTHAHHVRFWSRGGATEVGNLVSLCGRHHRQLHSGGLEVRFGVDGRVQGRWVRSGVVSGWFRNTVPDRMAEARSLAQHLIADDVSPAR